MVLSFVETVHGSKFCLKCAFWSLDFSVYISI